MDDENEGISESFQNLINDAFSLYHQGQQFEAKSRFTQLLNYVPGDPQCLFALGMFSFNEGNYDTAYKYLNESLLSVHHPKQLDCYMMLGIIAHQRKNYDEALNNYQKVLTLNPNHAESLYRIGLIYNSKGKLDEAVDYFCQSLISNPKHINSLYHLGLIYQNNKQLDKAIEFYEKALSIKKEFPLCLYQLGIIHLNNRSFDKAIELFEKALSLAPNHLDSIVHLSIAYQHADELNKAVAYARKALKIIPTHPLCLNNLGKVFMKLRKLKKAEQCFRRALAITPKNDEYLFSLAELYVQQKRYALAEKVLTNALKINPNSPRSLQLMGTILQHLGHYKNALLYFNKAIMLRPGYSTWINDVANTYCKMGRMDKGIEFYQKAISLKPDNTTYLTNLGVAYFKDRQYRNAEEIFERIIALDDNLATGYYHLGVIFLQQKKFVKAKESLTNALEKDANYADCLQALGNLYQELGDYYTALSYYKRALRIDPLNPLYMFGRSLVYLILGLWKKGWRSYEYRIKLDNYKIVRDFIFSLDNGEMLTPNIPITNKRLLIIHDQGFGDYLQFIRFAKLMKEQNAYVLTYCHKALVPLMKECPWIDEIYDKNSHFDYYIPVMSLAQYFQIHVRTIPFSEGYIKIKKAKINKYKDHFKNESFKVGFAFSGTKHYGNDISRSIDLNKWQPILRCSKVTFYSFQIDEQAQKKVNALKQTNIINLSSYIDNFLDTATLMMHMDLIITVDTSIAHLAGALGKPCWILIPKHPDWRWLLDRQDSPWYDSVRLFRQTKRGVWKNVIESVATELKKIKKEANK